MPHGAGPPISSIPDRLLPISPDGGDDPPRLEMIGIEKSFGTTRALYNVDFRVAAAEIVGLMGGNGAGKSTLMKILGGIVARDGGDIRLSGQSLDADHSPRRAMTLGVRFVHQELSLCLNLRIFENFAIELPDILGGMRWKSKAADFATKALEEIFPGNRIDPRAKVGALSLSQQQMVEIARAANHPSAWLLILDEPTSSLGYREAEQLRAFMQRRRQDGMSFIFISHRLHETLDLADRIAVMRNGEVAWSGKTCDISRQRIVQLLGGGSGELPNRTSEVLSGAGDTALSVQELDDGILRGIKLELQRGEIVGLAGLEGSGQRQILQSIYASSRKANPRIQIAGRLAFVSGDRANEGVFTLWSIDENIATSSFRGVTRWGILQFSKLHDLTTAWFGHLKIKASSGEVPVTSLSGGNQQKVVIARALAADADILLLDDPTRGVDMGTKADLYALFRDFARGGKAVLWYSTDDAEFRECDRTIVLRDGEIVAEFARSEVSEEKLVEASFRAEGASRERSMAQQQAERAKRRESITSALIPLATFALVFAICVSLSPRILSAFGLTLVFSAAFVLAFAAISQLFIIVAGDIDLGIGNFIGLVNAVAATWLVSDPWLALPCFLAFLVAYPLMGLFIELRRIPAIVVTLGLSFVWLGLAALRLPRAGGSAPEWLVEMLRFKLPLIPLPVLLCVMPALVAYLVLMVWRYGTVLRGFGANPRAIEAAGWSTQVAKATLYGFAGLFAVLAGVLVTASTRGGDPTGASSMTLLSVAAVILGGAAFSGGVAAPIGALFGTLTLVLVGTLLSMLGVNAVYLPMVQGLLLLGVIGVRTALLGRSLR